MIKQFWYALALLSGATYGSIANAQQSTSDVDELRARIDRLEQQNLELRQTVAQRLPAVDPETADASDQQFVSSAALTPEDARMRAAIQQYLAEQEAKKKAAADAQKAAGYDVGSDPSLTGRWTPDGATFRSPNGDFAYHVRGVAQLDYIGVQPLNPGLSGGGGQGTTNSVDFRRLRLGAEGTMYDNIDWVFEFDFALFLQNLDPSQTATPVTGLRQTPGNGSVAQGGDTINVIMPTTIYTTFKDLNFFGNIRVGNQQDWISLEHIESARFLDFMERTQLMDAFNGANNNGYCAGISAFNMTENKKLAWEYGVYKNNVYDSGYSYDYSNNAFTYGGRITGTPYYDEESEGRYLLHLGMGSELRTFNTELGANALGDNIRLRTRGDVRNGSATLSPNFTDTGNFYATSQTMLDPEFAFQWGSLLIQGEYNYSILNGARTMQGPAGAALGPTHFSGGYVEALYFLTGENRVYNRQSGVFGRVVPIENWFANKGAGARGRGGWQAGVRYDWIDLNSGAIHGGDCQNLTLGLNWFLNPNVRFQFNYVASFIDNAPNLPAASTQSYLNGSRFAGDGCINSFGTRLDFNF